MANQNQGLPVNDQTQAVLSKYGITAPKKITNIQNIQNKTETDIKIVQPDIRVSAPNIQVNPVEIAVQRYRSWVESAYGKQKELADKQKADLREKEYSLGKNVNKIFRKIEDLSSAIVNKARNFKKRLDSSMTPLVLLFISSMMPIIWGPLMKRIESIEYGFRYLFFGEIPPGMSENPDSFSFARSIRKFLGMDDSEGKTLLQGIGDAISEGVKKLIDYLDIQKDDRVQAVEEVLKSGGPGGVTWRDFFTFSVDDKLAGIFQYLGDIGTAAFGGSKAIGDRRQKRDVAEKIEKDKEKNTGKWGSGKRINHALKERTPAASYYLSDQAVKYINTPGEIEVEKLQLLFNEIRKLADKGDAYVSENFAKTFFGKDKIKELESSGKLKRTNIEINANTKDKNTKKYNYDYFKESSQNGLWDKDEHRVQGFTPKAMKAYKLDKSAISDLFGDLDSKSDFYNTENYNSFKTSISRFHKSIHKEEISGKAKINESFNKFHEIHKSTQSKIENWKNDTETYKHWNNAGSFNIKENIELDKNPDAFTESSELSEKVIEQAEKDMGKITYDYGGSGYNNTDCSGYISNVYKKFGVDIPRGTLNIYADAQKGEKAKWVDINPDVDSASVRQGKFQPNWNNLRPGDIMVWSRYGMDHAKNRGSYNYAGHVSMFTGKYDDEGNPIILGHSGPGPKSGKRERKGTKREGLNDLRSYLGTVRYDLGNKSKSSSTANDKKDPSEEEPEKKTEPTVKMEQSTTNTVPEYLRRVEENNETVIPTIANSYTQQSFVPDISRKDEETGDNETIPFSSLKPENKKEDYLKTIGDNLSITLKNNQTSVALKKMHAEKLVAT